VNETQALFGRGYFQKIVVCGGSTHGQETPEALEITAMLMAAGVPSEAIITECQSTNTGENVRFARRIIGDDVTEIFLLGKIYAKRRYAMTVKAHWKCIQRTACHGVNYFGVARSNWWQNPELRRRILEEARKIPRYLQLGYISEVSIVDGDIR
jgi:hypothetical protein